MYHEGNAGRPCEVLIISYLVYGKESWTGGLEKTDGMKSISPLNEPFQIELSPPPPYSFKLTEKLLIFHFSSLADWLLFLPWTK